MRAFFPAFSAVASALSLGLSAGLMAQDSAPRPDLPPMPIEPIGIVQTLPASYPEHWVMVDEASFFSMFGGKVIVLDVAEAEPGKRIKGMMDKNLLGNFTQAKTRPELYIIESFHERGSRGKRFDVLVIYDKQTLSPIVEIDWPNTRLQALPERYSMSVSGDERFLFVANFSPAASFSVVDLESRQITATIPTPGCVLTYPMGNRAVASICSNGAMLSSVIDDQGRLVRQQRSEPFFDTDKTPIFERPAIVDGIAYFPGFQGEMHMIDMRGDVAQHLGQWSLISDEERAQNWRPGGLEIIDKDDAGRVYIVMHPDGGDGTHNHGGPEVWVFDVKAQQRVQRIEVPNWAISVAVTGGNEPLLVVTQGELALDIFSANDGQFIQTVSDFGNITPLLVHRSY